MVQATQHLEALKVAMIEDGNQDIYESFIAPHAQDIAENIVRKHAVPAVEREDWTWFLLGAGISISGVVAATYFGDEIKETLKPVLAPATREVENRLNNYSRQFKDWSGIELPKFDFGSLL